MGISGFLGRGGGLTPPIKRLFTLGSVWGCTGLFGGVFSASEKNTRVLNVFNLKKAPAFVLLALLWLFSAVLLP